MFANLSRSWMFTKMSFRLLSVHKHLVLYPVLSTISLVLVLASFLAPLWYSGTLMQWIEAVDENSEAYGEIAMYGTAFVFYLVNYFVIVFFNTALVASVMKIMNGEAAPLSYGLSFAGKRFPQIFAWALLSAVIGVLLRMIENANKRVGRFVASLLGSAWTALTYFVVPVIAMEGLGPVAALKRSSGILRQRWGTALAGNFSLGLINFLTLLPLLILCGFAIVQTASHTDSLPILLGVIGLSALLLFVQTAVSSAASMVFKGYLYTYATGNSLPADIPQTAFADAFVSR